MQPVGKQGTENTTRVFTRGQLEYITWKFFYDEAEMQPVMPLDQQSWPTYSIIDPSGSILAQGVAINGGMAGHWKIGWSVPRSAQITTPMKRYKFSSVMLDTQGRQFEIVLEFDVVESAITAQDPMLQQFMTFAGYPLRLIFNNTVRPNQLNVSVFAKGNDGNPLFTAALTYPIPNPAGASDLQEIDDGAGGFTYYVDTPPITIAGAYSALWSCRDTVVSQLDYEHQVIQVVKTTTMHRINSIRMFIDKLQKKLGLVFAYSNEDMLEYLTQGTNIINSYNPPTVFDYNSPPPQLEALIILAGVWWGLNAQRILFAETNLNFCIDFETLLPTPRGLIRAKDLILNESLMLRKRISTQLIYDNEEALFDTICSNFDEGTGSIEIIEKLSLDTYAHKATRGSREGYCPVALGGLFARFTLSDFSSIGMDSDTTGNLHPIWDVPKFRKHLSDIYGMFHESEEGCYDVDTPLLTPYGFDIPTCAWLLKQKQVYRLENELGYDVVATGNHPILTLDTTTFEMVWKNMDEVAVGDLVALNTSIAEEENDWDVHLTDYANAVKAANTCKTQSSFTLPIKMTPELARLCGYLVSKGCLAQYDLIRFSNTSKEICDDFNYCCKTALGKEAEFIATRENNHGGTFSTSNPKPLHIYELYGVELRRFFFALGLGYEKSSQKRIPDVILRSPKHIAKEFLRGFLEGDGCFSKDLIILSSSSARLLSDLQQLLLRFGIISKKENPIDKTLGMGKVTVRGLSLVRYAETIGFLFKGNDFKEKTAYFPQREALSPDILYGISYNLRTLLGLNDNGWINTEEGKKHYSVYWHHNACGPHIKGHCQYITWDHVEKWFNDCGDAIKELNPDVWNSFHKLLETRFLWKKVVEVEKLDHRDVMDPSFVGHGRVLDHAFITNGIISHNSGQSVTLEYNPGADLESAMSAIKETLDNNTPKMKKNLFRWASGVGSIATRPYRFRSNLVFPVSMGTGIQLQEQIAYYGLSDWLG